MGRFCFYPYSVTGVPKLQLCEWHSYLQWGTHERAVRSGLMAAMKELNPHITDNQIMLKGLMLVLSIHIEDLWFESATYCKLASSYRDKAHQQPIHDELSRMAKDGVKELYMTNPDFRTFIEQLHDNS